MNTETMKFYYDNGLWGPGRLEKLLLAGRITQEQFQEITGEEVASNA